MNLNEIKTIRPPDWVLETIANGQRYCWIGAISFEDRCIASISSLKESKSQLSHVIALEYSTRVRQEKEDKYRRERNRQLIEMAAKEICARNVCYKQIHPYSFSQFQVMLDSVISENKIQCIVFDISCLTRIHALALAVMLADRDINWIITYTVPEIYGHIDPSIRGGYKDIGWKDIIIAPLAETATLINETNSRGIIIPGHESDRLVVALAEIEPSGGAVIIAENPRRPDLRYMCDRLNKKIIRQLLTKRPLDWDNLILKLTDYNTLHQLLTKQINNAMEHDAPVILFPYGPKLIVILSAIQLYSAYPSASWFIYPIPSGYDINHSEGIDHTLWLSGNGKNVRR